LSRNGELAAQIPDWRGWTGRRIWRFKTAKPGSHVIIDRGYDDEPEGRMSMGYGPNCVVGAVTIIHLSDGFQDAMQGHELQLCVRERRAQRAARDSWTSPRERQRPSRSANSVSLAPKARKRGYEPGQVRGPSGALIACYRAVSFITEISFTANWGRVVRLPAEPTSRASQTKNCRYLGRVECRGL